MKIETPNRMHATPQRATRMLAAADVEKRLKARFRPADQAHADALRQDDPHALAARFCTDIQRECANERANIRMDALAILSANRDAAGALVCTVDPAEVAKVPEDTRIGLEALMVKCEKENDRWIGVWQHTKTKLLGWLNRTGGEMQHHPFPSLGGTAAWIALPAATETWAVMQLMDSQAVVGEIPPIFRGIGFALISAGCGALGAAGLTLAADKRSHVRASGIGIILFTLALWFAENLFAVHMRAALEAGTPGNMTDILATFDRGVWWPFASPVALLIVGSSAFTTAAAWAKCYAYFGSPSFARFVHAKFRWSEGQLDHAEASNKGAVTTIVTGRGEHVDELVRAAWEPANAGHRMAEEASLTLAQADECFGAIDRIAHALVHEYATTMRRLRPGVDVTVEVELPSAKLEKLGDPQAIFTRVETVTRMAAAVEDAASATKTALRNLEVEFLRRVEARFVSTRNGTRTTALVPIAA